MGQVDSTLDLRDDLYDLAFDQFSRQWIAKSLIEDLRAKPRLKILDVGGRGGKTREFFEGDDVTVADLFDGDEPWYVKASGLDLPFDDGSFDVVTCFDVLEHVGPGDRARFVKEMARVSSDLVVIAAPFNAPLVVQAESETNQAWQELRGEPHPWLIEHIDNGLPERRELEGLLDELGLDYAVHHSNNLILWSALQRLIFLADFVKKPERIMAINRLYNQHLIGLGDALAPSYRLVFVGSKALGRRKLKSESAPAFEPEAGMGFVKEFLAAVEGMVLDEATTERLKKQLGEVKSELRQKEEQLQEFAQTLDDVYSSKAWRVIMGVKKIAGVVRRRQT
jgi:SAM-dependent methyltransferase